MTGAAGGRASSARSEEKRAATGERPDRTRRPPAGPPPPLRLPEFASFRLGSGLAVWVAESRDVPEVSLRLLVEAGASAEPPDRAGVAELTGRLLTEGAGARDATGMAEWLDRLGASFHAAVGYDAATLSMHFLQEVTEGALDFLTAVVREARFEAEEVERIRSERLDEIRRELDEPAVVADHALIRALYGSHLYGRPVGGEYESVEGVEREAVRSFHAEHCGAGGAALVACGDVRAEALREPLQARFGAWEPGAGRPAVEAAPERPVDGGRILLLDRPGSPQAEVRVGTVGAPYDAPDHYATQVANAVLGGLFNSRLNLNLREERGWTYGVRSHFRFRRAAGPFFVRTAVETAVTAGAFREVLEELRGLSERPPTDEELRLAKNALTLSLPLRFETNEQVSRKVIRRLAYDLPEDYWELYRERIEAVSREEIVEVGARYLGRERLALVAVADADAVRAELETLGPVEERAAPGGRGGGEPERA